MLAGRAHKPLHDEIAWVDAASDDILALARSGEYVKQLTAIGPLGLNASARKTIPEATVN